MEDKKISLFVAAGSGKTTKKINVNGKLVDAPYAPLQDRISLDYVVAEAIEAKRVRDIYVWGDLKELIKVQKKYGDQKDIIIVPQKGSLTDSIYETFMSYYLPLQTHLPQFKGLVQRWADVKKYIKQNSECLEEAIFLTTSDIPIVIAEDFDRIADDFSRRDLDFLIGVGKKQEMVEAAQSVGIDSDNSILKDLYKCYNLGGEDFRLNNMFVFKPLKLSLNIIRLIQQVYSRRYQYRFLNIMGTLGKTVLCTVKETAQHPSMIHHIPDILAKYVMINLAKTPWVNRDHPGLYEFCMKACRIESLERSASRALRGKLGIFTGGSYRTMIDIDEQESYDFFEKEGYFAKLKALENQQKP